VGAALVPVLPLVRRHKDQVLAAIPGRSQPDPSRDPRYKHLIQPAVEASFEKLQAQVDEFHRHSEVSQLRDGQSRPGDSIMSELDWLDQECEDLKRFGQLCVGEAAGGHRPFEPPRLAAPHRSVEPFRPFEVSSSSSVHVGQASAPGLGVSPLLGLPAHPQTQKPEPTLPQKARQESSKRVFINL